MGDHTSKRRGLLIAVIVLLLAAVGVVVYWLLFHPSGDSVQKLPQLEEPREPPQNETPAAPPSSANPAEPAEPVEPEEPTDLPEPHDFGTLRLYYDPGALQSEERDDQMTFRPLQYTDEFPRLDAQTLTGQDLTAEERTRLAVGLLQAYYADPPATADVSVTEDTGLDQGYFLRCDAMGEIPAMAARVRFLEADAQLWYLILLYSDGDTPDETLNAVFESASVS